MNLKTDLNLLLWASHTPTAHAVPPASIMNAQAPLDPAELPKVIQKAAVRLGVPPDRLVLDRRSGFAANLRTLKHNIQDWRNSSLESGKPTKSLSGEPPRSEQLLAASTYLSLLGAGKLQEAETIRRSYGEFVNFEEIELDLVQPALARGADVLKEQVLQGDFQKRFALNGLASSDVLSQEEVRSVLAQAALRALCEGREVSEEVISQAKLTPAQQEDARHSYLETLLNAIEDGSYGAEHYPRERPRMMAKDIEKIAEAKIDGAESKLVRGLMAAFSRGDFTGASAIASHLAQTGPMDSINADLNALSAPSVLERLEAQLPRPEVDLYVKTLASILTHRDPSATPSPAADLLGRSQGRVSVKDIAQRPLFFHGVDVAPAILEAAQNDPALRSLFEYVTERTGLVLHNPGLLSGGRSTGSSGTLARLAFQEIVEATTGQKLDSRQPNFAGTL